MKTESKKTTLSKILLKLISFLIISGILIEGTRTEAAVNGNVCSLDRVIFNASNIALVANTNISFKADEEVIISMYAGDSCLWSSDWSDRNIWTKYSSYYIGSDVTAIYVRTANAESATLSALTEDGVPLKIGDPSSAYSTDVAVGEKTLYDMNYHPHNFFVLEALDNINVWSAPNKSSKKIDRINTGEKVCVCFKARDSRYVWGQVSDGAYCVIGDTNDDNYFTVLAIQNEQFPFGKYKALYSVARKTSDNINATRNGYVKPEEEIEIIDTSFKSDYIWGKTSEGFWTALGETTGELYYLYYTGPATTPADEKTSYYDRFKAVAHATNFYSLNDQACAGFVCQCLFAGGIPGTGKKITTSSSGVKGTYGKVGDLYRFLTNNKYAVVTKNPSFKLVKKGHYKIVNTDVAVGDVLIIYTKNNKVYQHAAIITKINPDGTLYYSQHNVSRLNKLLTPSWAANGWGKDAELWLLHITY